MQFFPFGQHVPIIISVHNLPQKMTDYDIVSMELISEDLKVRGQRQVIKFDTAQLTITDKAEDTMWGGTIEVDFPAYKQVEGMVYHVKVEFKTIDDTKQLVFRNAFCMFDTLADIPPRLMLLDSTRQSDYCTLMGEIAVGRGKSAYDIACEEGFSGTKEEWLASLGQTTYQEYIYWCNHFGKAPLSEEGFWSNIVNNFHR